MPEGLTQTKTPTSKNPAGFKSECRPVSFRNRGRLQIGIPGRNKSESAGRNLERLVAPDCFDLGRKPFQDGWLIC